MGIAGPRLATQTQNIGNVERVVRILAGGGILSLAFVGPQSPWAWLGILPMLTGATGYCPPYAMLGINTCGKPRGGGAA